MKGCLIFIGLLLLTTTIHAQLTNTKWKGTANMAVPTDILLVFGTDSSAEAVRTQDSLSLAFMIFKINGQVLSLQKVKGIIPCDNNIIGTYKFDIIAGKLSFHLISDDCDARAHSLDGTVYDRVK